MPSTFVPAVKTLLACGLLAAVFAAPGSVLAAEGKATAENPKVKAQAEAVAKADEAALKELEKVKAEYDKKLAEAQRKAAVARIGARNKAIEELTKDKKRAILAEKLDEAMALKEKIDGMQKEADTLLAEGNAGVVEGKKEEGGGVLVGKWVDVGSGQNIEFFGNHTIVADMGKGKWRRDGDKVIAIFENADTWIISDIQKEQMGGSWTAPRNKKIGQPPEGGLVLKKR